MANTTGLTYDKRHREMRLGTRREPALVLVLILLTCGIYYLYFIYKASQEMDDFLGESRLSARHGSAACRS